MTHEIFLMRVMHRTGLKDRAAAEEITRHVIRHLAQGLSAEYAESVAEALPEPLATWICDPARDAQADLDSLYHAVAERLDVHVSFGLEFTQVICQVLGESVGHSGRQMLRSSLSEGWHPLFEPRQAIISPPGRRRDDRRTLSSAEPGSSRPISEARPGHRNSIARNQRPQFGTKLSTSRGKASRRTLASGRPGSSRPISDG